MNKALSIMTAVAVLGATAGAHAASIDFTTAATGAAVGTGNTSYTIDNAGRTGIDVTVTSGGGSITYQAGEGLGVSGKGSEDLNAGESLKFSFSTPVDLQSIGLTDLDGNRCMWNTDSGLWIVTNQQGQIVQQGAGTFSGNSKAVTSGDALTIDVSSIVASISAVSVYPIFGGFNLGSVSFNAVSGAVNVPELSASGSTSAAFLLAGVGLLLTGKRRRQLV
jgi:hypothetical protein